MAPLKLVFSDSARLAYSDFHNEKVMAPLKLSQVREWYHDEIEFP